MDRSWVKLTQNRCTSAVNYSSWWRSGEEIEAALRSRLLGLIKDSTGLVISGEKLHPQAPTKGAIKAVRMAQWFLWGVQAKAHLNWGQKPHLTTGQYYSVKPILAQNQRKIEGIHVAQAEQHFPVEHVLSPSYASTMWVLAVLTTLDADVLLVDKWRYVINPWLTVVIWWLLSRCVIGINLGYGSSSQVVALAVRHAILRKQYGAE